METFTAILAQAERPLKHSVRYNTVDKDDAPISSIYVNKAGIRGKTPAKIKVTVEDA